MLDKYQKLPVFQFKQFIERDIKDASTPGLSSERKFCIANKEAQEILAEANNFSLLIKQWIKTNYPQYEV